MYRDPRGYMSPSLVPFHLAFARKILTEVLKFSWEWSEREREKTTQEKKKFPGNDGGFTCTLSLCVCLFICIECWNTLEAWKFSLCEWKFSLCICQKLFPVAEVTNTNFHSRGKRMNREYMRITHSAPTVSFSFSFSFFFFVIYLYLTPRHLYRYIHKDWIYIYSSIPKFIR